MTQIASAQSNADTATKAKPSKADEKNDKLKQLMGENTFKKFNTTRKNQKRQLLIINTIG